MTTHATSVEIALLNNEGAGLLEAGDMEGAIRCFSSIVQASRDLFHQCRTKVESTSVVCAASSLDTFIRFEATATKSNADLHEEHAHIFFQRPVRIDTLSLSSLLLKEDGSNATSSSGFVTSVKILTVIGIFNLALSFHLSSLSLGRSNDINAAPVTPQKLVRLYELALQLHNSLETAPCLSRSIFFHMAILNNLAHAHTMGGNRSMSEDCYQQILSTLMFLVDTASTSSELPANVTFDCFFQSTHHLMVDAKSYTPPAAAA